MTNALRDACSIFKVYNNRFPKYYINIYVVLRGNFQIGISREMLIFAFWCSSGSRVLCNVLQTFTLNVTTKFSYS